MAKKIVIVGGVAGGATAAARLRRLDETAEIIMFEKDEYISFANCGLPYHIGGTIEERGALIVQSPEAMRRRFRIDVRTNSRVAAVDTKSKSVSVQGPDGEYAESYDVLVLSPGAEPVVPNIVNTAPDRVFTLRSIRDTDRINNYITETGATSAAVIGGGFVGVEMAENLTERGVAVRLVEALDHILAPFDGEMANIAQREMRAHRVELLLGDGISAIEGAGEKAKVTLASGASFETDMVVMAIGVRPATAFLKDSGVELGPKGHIVADEHMRTNIPDVYAAGDAVQIKDFVTGQPTAVPLAGPANRQARVAADNIAGIAHTYGGAQGTAVIKVFGLTAAATGANERTLKRLNMPYRVLYTHPFSHATYYPGAQQIAMKLLIQPDGRILGCQAVGADGVDKRVDVVATAIRLHAKATDLCELELAYAPPYSSAKDPVNMLGYVAENILEGLTDLTDFDAAEARDVERSILLDVRTPREYANGHVPGAVNIPVDELRDRLSELDPEKEIYEYCQVGVRAHTAQRILKQHGFRVKNVSGGWKTFANRE